MALFLGGIAARGSVALLVEEPFGRFGAMNPTGHAAIYLDRVCAETPVSLRTCHPGELGVVISRYYKVNHYDWVAIPLIPYLYAVEDKSEIPIAVTGQMEADLRDAYRRRFLREIVPDAEGGHAPVGDWIQMVGASYDRRIYGYQVSTTPSQDAELIATYNEAHNHSHFNLLFQNCADFSRKLLNLYFPKAVHRNFLADGGITTPKQISKSFVKYARKHDELELRTFVIPQVPGDIPRSSRVNGVAESLVKSKKYLLPLVFFRPELTAGIIAAYVGNGRFEPPKDARVFRLEEVEELARENPTVPMPDPAAGSR
ncbi:hypothetical protein [Terriglobus tenax]|uniref:hypothetical protein n=1 Tax=Terriglobus tenax TaxID=1111115 RepID=UPI0021DF9B66|nr:hypothetical protein [Terriglobus tenax]